LIQISSLLVFHCFSLKKFVSLQMLVKRLASKWTSQEGITSSDSSSGGNEQFIISPCPRRATRKATRRGEGSSSWVDEEAARVVEGRAVAMAREARASDII
jgi:hypothetical protein